MNPFGKKSLKLHKRLGGKLEIKSKTPIRSKKDLALVYTPGVGAVSLFLDRHPNKANEYTIKSNTIAVISDATAVLGYGRLKPEGAIPVLEGKCLILKELAGVDAFPISLKCATKSVKEIVEIIQAISPIFGAIMLEDIAAPECFEIEERLQKELSIPVMHDDQHGTAVVVLAALINACKVVSKNPQTLRVVISGAGAAGSATAKLIHAYGFKNITVADSRGVLSKSRADLNARKRELLSILSPHGKTLEEAMRGADAFIGLSAPGIVHEHMIRSMNKDAIVFSMANPIPEIMPLEAQKAGARIVASGRSDFPNQINNSLSFPGIFRGLLDYRVQKLLTSHKLKAARALAALVKKPRENYIIPDGFDARVVPAIKRAIR